MKNIINIESIENNINKENNIENNIKNNEENYINEEYVYDSDPEFTENELNQIYADLDDEYSEVKNYVVGIKKSEWDKFILFPYIDWVKEYFSFKYAEKRMFEQGFFYCR